MSAHAVGGARRTTPEASRSGAGAIARPPAAKRSSNYPTSSIYTPFGSTSMTAPLATLHWPAVPRRRDRFYPPGPGHPTYIV